MMMHRQQCQLASDTLDFGGKLATALSPGTVIFLEGCLGAGKTTLARSIITALGHSGKVKSPTYTLVEPYELYALTVYHFDLYRLADAEELEYMGIRDYFTDKSVCLIEWASRGEDVLPKPDVIVDLAVKGDGRVISVFAKSEKGETLVAKLQREFLGRACE